jgi:hypothetical protein
MTTPRDIGLHVRLHIPDPPTEPDNNKSDVLREPEFTRHTFYSSPVDEKSIPAGIGWTSILVMRNLARYANRQHFQNQNQKRSLMDEFFGHVKAELWHNVSVSRTLMFWLNDLMKMVTKTEMAGLDGIQAGAVDGAKDTAMG